MERPLLSLALIATLLVNPGTAEEQLVDSAAATPRPANRARLAPARYPITDLGSLGGWSEAHAVSNNGKVAGRYLAGTKQRAFVWENGTMQDLGTLGEWSEAYGVNDEGKVAGITHTNSGHPEAFLWHNGTMQSLGTLGGISSGAYGINNAGQVTGYAINGTQQMRAFLWNGAMADLGALQPSLYSFGYGINDGGQVVGWAQVGSQWPYDQHAFLHSGGMQDLGTLGWKHSIAYGINGKGDVVGRLVNADQSDWHAFLSQGGGMQDLGGTRATAYGINNAGLIVGESDGTAVLWEDGQMKALNTLIPVDSGWVLTSARAINNRGQIVGYGLHNGQKRAFQLGGLKIIRPSAGEKWIAGEKDTIRWIGGQPGQILDLEYSVDSCRTFLALDYVAHADSGQYVWYIPINTLSKKCCVRIKDYFDQSLIDTSDVFRIKPYVLTRDSSGQYEPYRPEEDQWKFYNNDGDMWFPAWYRQFDYRRGTDPFTGYSYLFAPVLLNIAATSRFPDWVSWVRAFGTDACYLNTSFPPVYSPMAVIRWHKTALAWKGSCFGIAASNALAFSSRTQFRSTFPEFPAFASPATVSSDSGVRLVVNGLFSHQYGNPTRQLQSQARWSITPNETLHELQAMLREDNASSRTLAFYNNNGDGGHCVLPYKLQQHLTQKHVYFVFVDDNSQPGKLVLIQIDTLANGAKGVWTPLLGYANWGGPAFLLLMTPSSDYLQSATLPKRTAGHTSPFVVSKEQLEIYPPEAANFTIRDALGNATGHRQGSTENGIPQAAPLYHLDGSESPPYAYALPVGAYSVLMDSLVTDTVETTFFTGNRALSYRRTGASPDQTDMLHFDGGLEVANPDPQARPVSLTAIVNETVREKVFTISSLELAQNDSVRIDHPDSNTIRLISRGTAKEYDLELNLATGGGIGRFGAQDIVLSANTTHSIAPEWNTVGGGRLKILVDRGNDGTIDDTLSLQNRLTGTGGREEPVIPQEYRLEQNYPNPFNPTTTIRYALPRDSYVTLRVYNVLGQEVEVLVDRNMQAGYHSAVWNAGTSASGAYFYRLQAGPFVAMRRLVVVR